MKENMFEKYFEMWLNDLQKVGLVRNWKKEPESIVVLEPVVIYSNMHYIRKESTMVSHNVLQPASYTRDYDVEFHKSMLDVLIGLLMKEDDSLVLKELRSREKGDSFYDFKYYYIFKESEADSDYFTVSFDVKPPATAIRFSGGFGSARSFPYNQKLMIEKYGIFVNKVVPCKQKDSLFNQTFIPSSYFLTDSGKQPRKFGPKDKIRTIKEWMAENQIEEVKHA